jgi:hypothetical protein
LPLVPREFGVEGTFDKDGILHIFFRYLDQEEAVTKVISSKLRMKLGKHSGKILGFEVETTKHDIKEITLNIDQAIQRELPRLTKFNQRANFEVIKSVIDRHRDALQELAFAAT